MLLGQSDILPRWSERIAVAALVGTALWGAAALVVPRAVDTVGLLLTLLTLLITVVVLAFSRRYMRADPRRGLFALQVMAFAAAMIFLSCARDLVSFALAWVASGQVLARLVAHSNGCGEAGQAARRCRISFLIGDAALVSAFAILGTASGSLLLSDGLAATTRLSPEALVIASFLLLVAAAARCALPPFSGWLLGSMAAPTPVSALMHGGFVNGGGFLLIRFSGLLDAVPAAQIALLALGTGAAIYGGAVMLVRPDVKGALAGSTVSQMGFMLLTCGLGAYALALWHLIAHGLFKAWLFLGSGSTVGMVAPGSAPPRRAIHAAIIASATMVLVALAMLMGWSGPALVPQALAIAATLSAIDLVHRRQSWPMLVTAGGALLLGLVVAHSLTSLVTGPARVGGDAVPLGILLVLLAGWVGQRHIATRGLPAPLYVRLVNSGALHAR